MEPWGFIKSHNKIFTLEFLILSYDDYALVRTNKTNELFFTDWLICHHEIESLRNLNTELTIISI